MNKRDDDVPSLPDNAVTTEVEPSIPNKIIASSCF